MTEILNLYTKRKIEFFLLNDKENIDEILKIKDKSIPNLICIIKKNDRMIHLDFGSWCYTNTKFDRKNIAENIGCLVELKSLKKDRIKGVQNLLNDIFNKNLAYTTIYSLYKTISTIIKFINKNFEKHDLSNLKDAEEIYIGYSKKLIADIEIKKNELGKIVSTEGFKNQQSQLAKFLSYCTQVDINHFYSLIRMIESYRVKKFELKNDTDNNITNKIKILVKIFTTLADHILNNKELPCMIDLKEYNIAKIYIDLNLISKADEFYIECMYEKDKIVTFDEFKKNINLRTKDKHENQKYIANYKRKIKRVNYLNSLEFKDCETKILMTNFCIICFAKLLISVSGANESVIYKLKMNEFETISSEKGKRAYGIKNRSNSKKVSIEFGLKFKQIFKKYISLREMINNIYKDDISEYHKSLLFIKLPINRFLSINKITEIDSILFDKFNKTYKSIFKVTTATNKELRKNVANNYLNSTNSIILTSIKLGNTPKILDKFYSDASFDEMAYQLTDYFDSFEKNIVLKGRNDSNHIPVKFESKSIKNTVIGNCSTHSPKLISGFNDQITTLECKNPKSCLFCDSYVVFLNKEDIRKLISLKFVLEFNNQIKEEKIRIIYRIDEILNFIVEKNHNLKEAIYTITEEVNEGFLDEYWNNHLNMLIEMDSL
ncbi:hypothetical protein [Acinetobacter junii]|uniref:hypothetical protein n=1 Tax=Acinetobacter junii TaxID=40215 RepID=UPI003215EADD